jgi:hypothetical protein
LSKGVGGNNEAHNFFEAQKRAWLNPHFSLYNRHSTESHLAHRGYEGIVQPTGLAGHKLPVAEALGTPYAVLAMIATDLFVTLETSNQSSTFVV